MVKMGGLNREVRQAIRASFILIFQDLSDYRLRDAPIGICQARTTISPSRRDRTAIGGSVCRDPNRNLLGIVLVPAPHACRDPFRMALAISLLALPFVSSGLLYIPVIGSPPLRANAITVSPIETAVLVRLTLHLN